MSMTIDYENPWIYKGTNFTSEHIDDFFGFVYRPISDLIYYLINLIKFHNNLF